MNPPLSLIEIIEGEKRNAKSASMMTCEAGGDESVQWDEVEQSGTPWRKRPRQSRSAVVDKEATCASLRISCIGSKGAISLNEESGSGRDGREGKADDVCGRQVLNSKVDLASLTEEQLCVLSVVLDEGKNIFFTGAAGTGQYSTIALNSVSVLLSHNNTIKN